MGATTEVRIVLVTEECVRCGVVFGMTSGMNQQRIDDKQSFYCPNGHSQHYLGESQKKKITRLESQLNHQSNVTEMKRVELKTERSAHRRTIGKLGASAKKLNRVDNGVCPKCNRSFVNVGRHMKSKHT